MDSVAGLTAGFVYGLFVDLFCEYENELGRGGSTVYQGCNYFNFSDGFVLF